MKSFLSAAGNLIRFSNWWNSKVPFLMAIAYWALGLANCSLYESLQILFGLLCWIFCSAAVGHVINDWGDIEVDSRAEKENAVAKLSIIQRCVVLISLLALLYVSVWYAKERAAVLIVTTLQLLLFVVYSHPFFRWKEKLWLGIFADAAYAFMLPVIAVIAFCGCGKILQNWHWVLGFVWLLAIGLRNILLHQLADKKADKKSGVKTLPLLLGDASVFNLINRILLVLEVVSFLLFTTKGNQTLALINLIAFVVWLLIKIAIMWKEIRTAALWRSSNHPSFALLNNFYEQVLPIVFLLLLIVGNRKFSWLLPMHLFLFFSVTKEFFKSIIAFCVYLRCAVSKNLT